MQVIICFSVPFLPFLSGEHSFLKHPEYNPFLLQMCQGNDWNNCKIVVWFFIIGSFLIVFASFMWKRMNDLYFLAGLFLFMLVLAAGIRYGFRDGLNSVLFDAKFDKSYFNVCIPFLLFYINEIKKRQFSYSTFLIDY